MVPYLVILFVSSAFATDWLGAKHLPKCSKGSEVGCYEKCNRTCNDYYNPPSKACPRTECWFPVCICDPKQDYYYNGKKCVHKDKCPKPGTTGQSLPQCPRGYELACPGKCHRTCKDYYDPPCEPCPRIECLVPVCVCDPKQGFFYDGDKCVSKDKCPKPPGPSLPKCPKGYELGCPGRCNRTCKDYFEPPSKKCPNIQCFVPVCVCDPKQGYYYDGKKCVHKDKCPRLVLECPEPVCPKGQEYVYNTSCNRLCADYYSPKKDCPIVKCEKKCICAPSQGYYWHETEEKCVHYSQCPRPCN